LRSFSAKKDPGPVDDPECARMMIADARAKTPKKRDARKRILEGDAAAL
jgi:hypothetical protein